LILGAYSPLSSLNAVTVPLQAVPAAGTFPHFDAAEALERQIRVVQQLVDVNAAYARQLAEATNTVADAVRQHLEGLNTVARQQVQSVSEVKATWRPSRRRSTRLPTKLSGPA